MSKSLTVAPLDEIKQLHSEIISSARTTLDKAIRIGELLTEQRGKLKHGQWLPWVRENLPFSDQTARRYMGVYLHRDEIQHNVEFELTDAYRLLSEPVEPEAELALPQVIRPEDLAPPPKETTETCPDCGKPFDSSKWDSTGSGFKCPYCWRDNTATPTPERMQALIQREETRRAVEVEEPKRVIATLFTGDAESYTPKEYIEAARGVMGGIDIDPASNPKAQETVKAEKFFTAEDNGLDQFWRGNVFLNPPYSFPLIRDFINKLIAGVKSGEVSQAILLTNDNTDTGWWQDSFNAAGMACLLNHRINFRKPDGTTSSPTNGQTFFYFGKNKAKFAAAFSQFGTIATPYDCLA